VYFPLDQRPGLLVAMTLASIRKKPGEESIAKSPPEDVKADKAKDE
jgi:hypothetical protein